MESFFNLSCVSQSCDDLENTLRLVIHNAASSLGMEKISRNNSFSLINKPWHDKECSILKNKLKNLLKHCKKVLFSEESKTLYLAEKNGTRN